MPNTNKPEWWEVLIDAADKFIVTPREQMEYDAQLARARADEALATAHGGRPTKPNAQHRVNIAAVGVIGLWSLTC